MVDVGGNGKKGVKVADCETLEVFVGDDGWVAEPWVRGMPLAHANNNTHEKMREKDI